MIATDFTLSRRSFIGAAGGVAPLLAGTALAQEVAPALPDRAVGRPYPKMEGAMPRAPGRRVRPAKRVSRRLFPRSPARWRRA